MDENIIQKNKDLISHEIDTKCIIIYWKPRNWKTILAVTIWYESYRKRIYSNFNIYRKWVSINKKFNTFAEVSNIRFSYEHGVIIVDESGINVNSKDGRTDTNRTMQEILFLSGKKNCDMIMIAQSYESIDINFRRNAQAIFYVEKIKRYWRKPTFKVERQVPDGEKMRVIATWEVQTLDIMDYYKITYDTLEESRMTKKTKKEKEEEEEEQKKYRKQKD